MSTEPAPRPRFDGSDLGLAVALLAIAVALAGLWIVEGPPWAPRHPPARSAPTR